MGVEVHDTKYPYPEEVDKTQLTGRNVEEIYAFNALAITDISSHFSNPIDLSKYSKVFVIAENSLDQPITIQWLIDEAVGSRVYNTSTSAWETTTDSIDIPASQLTNKFLLNTYFNEFDNVALKNTIFYAKCSTTPTSGSLTIKLWGLPN